MRNPERIDEILIKLSHLWHKHPDYRFGQLLINYGLAPDELRFWNAEDDDLIKTLTKIMEAEDGKSKKSSKKSSTK